MNIKSLLLGSAAALVAVSGAQAADAIIAAEPEPLEYVRVCDAFGTGYFYIPGTETCLKIGGYVRFDVRGGDLLGADLNGDGDGDEWATHTRFTLRVSTASDTELGALQTFVEARWNYRDQTGFGDQGTDTTLNFAYIDLAGFRVGLTESAFVTYSGYAGNVIQDDIGVSFGSYETNVIQYNYDSGTGFTGVISLEDFPDRRNNYVPNVVGGIGYTSGAFSGTLTAAYDSSTEEGTFKARVDGSFGGFSAFLMGAYSTGDYGYWVDDYATWGGEWAVWGGISVPVTEAATINAQLAYDDYDTFQANLNLAYTVVPGFTVTPEVVYVDDDVLGGQWGGMVRFQRSF